MRLTRLLAFGVALLLAPAALAGNSGNSPPRAGGSGGTITTASPLSGDGSSGTPATIAAGALNLNILASIADQTFLCNVSGGTAAPIACTVAQMKTALNLPNFGTVTTLTLPDSLSNQVTSFVQTNSFTTSTAGAVTARLVIQLPLAGSLTTAFTLDPALLTLPTALSAGGNISSTGGTLNAGTNGSAGAPSVRITNSEVTGWYRGFGQTMSGSINGAAAVHITGNGYITNAVSGQGFFLDFSNIYGMKLLTTTTAIISNNDVQIGADGAVATGAAVGFLDPPSMAGDPTAAATGIRTGKVAWVYDSTNKRAWTHATKWYAINRFGKGTDVASAGTLTLAAVDRTSRDYFKVTGTTTVDFIAYTASDVYGDILDGQCLKFRFSGSLTLNHNTGSPPAGTKPLLLQGAGNAALSAGAMAELCRDDNAGGFVEMYRRAP